MAGWLADLDDEEEATFYGQTLVAACERPLRTVLELGSGGGNNASHLKNRFEMVLVEPSAGMRAVSRALNPECQHVEGDMRSVRLAREFDAVFVHDAVCRTNAAFFRTHSSCVHHAAMDYMHISRGRVGLIALWAADRPADRIAPSV